jgi:mono/diheme cytochrome c family protein
MAPESASKGARQKPMQCPNQVRIHMKSMRRSAVALLGGAAFAIASQAAAETLLERGTYLMQSIVACGNCHTPQGPKGPLPGMDVAGGLEIKEPGFTVYTPNITPDPETGIGKWTDAQIITSIREGKRPDGTIIGPPMPIGLYRGMSDTDVKAIVAYLRTVKPVKNIHGHSDSRGRDRL